MRTIRIVFYRAILVTLLMLVQGCISAKILFNEPIALAPDECIVLMRITAPEGKLAYSVGSADEEEGELLSLPRNVHWLRLKGKDVFLIKLGSGEHYKVVRYEMKAFGSLYFTFSRSPTYFSCKPGFITYVGDLVIEPQYSPTHIRGVHLSVQDKEEEILETATKSHPIIMSQYKYQKILARNKSK